jgi:hypothetical protein
MLVKDILSQCRWHKSHRRPEDLAKSGNKLKLKLFQTKIIILILVTKGLDKVEHHLFKVIFIEETMKYGSIFLVFAQFVAFQS